MSVGFEAGCWALSKMVSGGRAVALAALLVLTCQPAMASEVVDLEGALPLGTVVVDEGAGKVYFSLGNGRAISDALDAGEGKTVTDLQQALLEDGSAAGGAKPLRRNIRWSR